MKHLQNMVTSFLVAAVVLAALTWVAFRRSPPIAQAAPLTGEPVVSAPSASAPAASTVHCVHEICAARPHFLQCADGHTTCRTFEIMYERHCDCDRWAE